MSERSVEPVFFTGESVIGETNGGNDLNWC